MNFRLLTASTLALLLSVTTAYAQLGAVSAGSKPAAKSKQPKPKTVTQQISYGFGLNIGRRLAASLKRQGTQIDADFLARGVADAIAGRKSQLTEAELAAAFRSYERAQALRRLNANPQLKAIADKNKKEGDAFLAANAKKPGIKVTKSGLQYKILRPGTGPQPKKTDSVTAHYHGTLLSGEVFDSSVKRGKPLDISVTGVIAGWTEALLLMKVGAKWRLFIPSELAYDLSPRPGGKIGPNAVLIFEIELIGIKK